MSSRPAVFDWTQYLYVAEELAGLAGTEAHPGGETPQRGQPGILRYIYTGS